MSMDSVHSLDPFFMYGTAWKDERTEDCVSRALQAGFRAIDTANQRKHYYEEGVGQGLLKAYDSGLVSRADILLQTKFTYQRGQDDRLPYDPKASLDIQVQQSFASSLGHLHTDYIDSYVLHGPASGSGMIDDDWQVWEAMEALKNAGKARVLAVSNVSAGHLRELVEHAAIKPSFVQNRCYASKGWDREVRGLCADHGLIYQGFSLLTANRQLQRMDEFQGLVEGFGRTPAQLIFRFARQLGMLPLTGTTDSSHMDEDLDILDFELGPLEMEVLEEMAG
jgi:diketogulonate reductase-like aldo/keto reductase